MKKLFYLSMLIMVGSFLTSCKKRSYADNYRYGNENMTRVQSYDQNGNLMEYFIAQSMYNNLMRQGGQAAVNNYYVHNRASMDRSYSRYDQVYSRCKIKSRYLAERRNAILNEARNKQRARSAVQKSFSSRSKYSGSSISPKKSSSSFFKSSPSSRSSYRSSSFRSSRR